MNGSKDQYTLVSFRKLSERLETMKMPEDAKELIKGMMESLSLSMRYDILKKIPSRINKTLLKIKKAIDDNKLTPTDHEIIIEELEEILSTMKIVSIPEVNIGRILKSFVPEYSEQRKITLPFSFLNSKLGCLQQGLCVFAGASNIGKTAIINNIVAGWLEKDMLPDVLYISLDDPVDYTWKRIISIVTKTPLDEIRDLCFNDKKKHTAVLVLANTFSELQKANKLVWHDIKTCPDIKSLEMAVRQFTETASRPVVIIDGVFNLACSSSNFYDKRQENIERFNELKKIADKFNISIMFTAEIGKDKQKNDLKDPLWSDCIMETGKVIYNAAYILTVFPESYEQFQNTKNESFNLILNLAKSKRSRHKGGIKFNYDRECCRLTEIEEISVFTKKPVSSFSENYNIR